VVVGGGISGLAAAYRLQQAAEERRVALDIRLLEAGERVGGAIASERSRGLLLERGPDSMISEKPWGLELCEELGLGSELIGTREGGRRSFIARGRKLVAVPEGFYLLAPSRLAPLLLSPLFSTPGKLRMAADLFIPRRRGDGDESLANFVRRRLGREALERAAQPMVGGIYTADPETLSLQATMPRFLEMERRHGSVIRAMARGRRLGRSAEVGEASGPRYGLFVALRDGMQTLSDRLAEALPQGTINCSTPVQAVERGANGGWRVVTENAVIDADALCLALPAAEAARLLEGVDAALSTDVAAVASASAATVNLAYRRDDVAHPLDGFGFVVPAVEGRTVLACTFADRKFVDRAPEGTALLRAFVGGAMFPEKLGMDDEEMVSAVVRDLDELLGLSGEPREVLVSRHPSAMAQYHVGHLARVERIETAVGKLKGLALAGNFLRGTGIPDCVHSANAAAHRLAERLFGQR
jgi:oxygen-dependent protoporphyrinogen oxidase